MPGTSPAMTKEDGDDRFPSHSFSALLTGKGNASLRSRNKSRLEEQIGAG
jgi:hypothetical protein